MCRCHSITVIIVRECLSDGSGGIGGIGTRTSNFVMLMLIMFFSRREYPFLCAFFSHSGMALHDQSCFVWSIIQVDRRLAASLSAHTQALPSPPLPPARASHSFLLYFHTETIGHNHYFLQILFKNSITTKSSLDYDKTTTIVYKAQHSSR